MVVSRETAATLDTAIALLAWYAFNGAFNVENKRILNELSYPWIISWVQLATGIGIAVPAWLLGLRRAPVMTWSVLMRFLPIAVLHAAGHALQVAGIGAGSVYFGTVIKATEPLIGTIIAFVADGKVAPWYVNLTFLPIVGGVAYAAAKPGAKTDLSDLLSFAALAALSSTILFAMAKLLVKRIMTKEMKQTHGLDAPNTYSVLTCCSAALLLVPSFAAEGPAALAAVGASEDGGSRMTGKLLLCGFFYFAYNECGFRVLDDLNPVRRARLRARTAAYPKTARRVCRARTLRARILGTGVAGRRQLGQARGHPLLRRLLPGRGGQQPQGARRHLAHRLAHHPSPAEAVDHARVVRTAPRHPSIAAHDRSGWTRLTRPFAWRPSLHPPLPPPRAREFAHQMPSLPPLLGRAARRRGRGDRRRHGVQPGKAVRRQAGQGQEGRAAQLQPEPAADDGRRRARGRGGLLALRDAERGAAAAARAVHLGLEGVPLLSGLQDGGLARPVQAPLTPSAAALFPS